MAEVPANLLADFGEGDCLTAEGLNALFNNILTWVCDTFVDRESGTLVVSADDAAAALFVQLDGSVPMTGCLQVPGPCTGENEAVTYQQLVDATKNVCEKVVTYSETVIPDAAGKACLLIPDFTSVSGAVGISSEHNLCLESVALTQVCFLVKDADGMPVTDQVTITAIVTGEA